MRFHFKSFSIKQEQSAMKVGTDGVLLGAWVNPKSYPHHILDIGTGTGLKADFQPPWVCVTPPPLLARGLGARALIS